MEGGTLFTFACISENVSTVCCVPQNPIQTVGGGGGERFRGHPRLNLNNFKTVQVMTAKLSEFSSNLSENILKSS